MSNHADEIAPDAIPSWPPETITPQLLLPHKHYMKLSGSALRLAVGLTAGLCFVAFGWGQGDIGGLMVVDSFRNEFPQMDPLSNPTLHVAAIAGAVVATWNLGCFVGAMITIFVGDRLGRKGSITVGLVIMIIGKIVQSASFGFGQYIAGRFLAGLGNGFIASTVPAWQAECLKTHRRGTLLLVSFGSCITLGLAAAYWVDYAFSWIEPNSVSWRFPIAFGTVFMVWPLAMIIFLPESPRFLILTGREQEAKNVLSALNEQSPEDEDTRREFLMIKNTLLHMTTTGVMDAFRMGKHRWLHRTILAVCLQVMQQFTGVNLFMQYLGSMFAGQLLYPVRMALLLASCCATAFFLSSLVAVIGIDRFWGRRTLTMFGAAGMCGCLTVLCIMAWLGTQTAHYVMTAFLFLYCSFFSIGWQGMSWLWAVELVPLSTRGPANSCATAANWLANFIVVLVTPYLFTNTTFRTYIVFAVTNFCIVPAIYFFYPETGYRSLEEVDIIFANAAARKHSWVSVVSTAKEEPVWYKEGHKSDSYASESGRTYTANDEKSETKEKHGSQGSDAVKWSYYCRERETSGSSSDGSPVRPSDEAAPPPTIHIQRPSNASLAPYRG